MKNKFKIHFLLIALIFYAKVYSQNASYKYSEGLAPFKIVESNKRVLYGFVNHQEKEIIPPQFDTIYCNFKNGLASVGKNKKAGVINKSGKVIIPFEYNAIGAYDKLIIPVESIDGLWGFYNYDGKLIVAPQYQNFRIVSRSRILVQKNDKWGLIEMHGKILIPIEYRWIDEVNEITYKLYFSNSWALRTINNTILSKFNFDSLAYTGSGLYRYSVIGKYGVINSKGEKLINPIFQEIGCFEKSYVKARKGLAGVIDISSKEMIPFKFDDVIIDSLYIRVMQREHLANGNIKEKWGLYDFKGKQVIAPRYAKMNEYSDGLIAVMKDDGTWGYINAKGENVIIFRYNYAENFKDGIAKVSVPYYSLKTEYPAIINKNGDYVISPAEYQYYVNGWLKIDHHKKSYYIIPKNKYSNVLKLEDGFYNVSSEGKHGVVDNTGRIVIPVLYDDILYSSNSKLFVVRSDRKYGVIDKYGKFTLKLTDRFEKIDSYNEGFARVMLNGKYGVINNHGDIYISPQYPAMGEMHDSLISVILKGKWAFLDYRENLKVQPYYDEVNPFCNGVALVREGSKWNLVNRNGKEMHLSGFDFIEKTEAGNYILKAGNKVGFADSKGREIISPRYEAIEELGDNYFKVKKNGMWGVLNKDENIVLPIEFEIIQYEPVHKIFLTGISGKQETLVIK